MIISDTYRYVFVQIPHTASTAIAEELIRFYDGRPILKKHSYVPEFERAASRAQKDYFVFGSIRNPLDERVSSYWKLRSDHLALYSHEGELQEGVEDRSFRLGRRRYEYLRAEERDFEDYFRKFCRYTYDSPVSLRKSRYNKVMRYEDIRTEFRDVLQALGISPERDLQEANPTSGREKNFTQYYTPSIIPRAVRIFGPFMEEWGYAWPDEWSVPRLNWSSRLGYKFWGGVRRAFWRTAGFMMTGNES